MGMFDYVYDGTEIIPGQWTDQVKCWRRELRTFCLNDTVPSLNECSSYSVFLRDAALWMNVTDRVISSFTPYPVYYSRFNKYGNEWTNDEC